MDVRRTKPVFSSDVALESLGLTTATAHSAAHRSETSGAGMLFAPASREGGPTAPIRTYSDQYQPMATVRNFGLGAYVDARSFSAQGLLERVENGEETRFTATLAATH